jgi:hypothetical protein
LFAFVLALLVASGAWANQISYFQTQFGTDWTLSGISGLRGLGTGNITIAGVSGTVTRAYLYWHGPTNLSNPAANANVTFNGVPIVGTNIGLSDDNNWGFQNSQAYRADVTALVPGDGVYNVGNMVKPNVEINGSSLVVFYNDGNGLNNRDVVIFDGNDSNLSNPYDPPGWAATLSGINYSGGQASLVVGISDGQSFSDEALLLNGLTVVPAGQNWDGISLPDAGGGVSNGKLYDIASYDVTSFLNLGPNTLSMTGGPLQGDALSLVHFMFDLPAGAAPPDPSVIPEPATLALLGVAGIGLAIRRRKRR